MRRNWLTVILMVVLIEMLLVSLYSNNNDVQSKSEERLENVTCPKIQTCSKEQEEKEEEKNKKTAITGYAIDRSVWQRYPGEEWQGLQLPVLSVYPQGQLGNVMLSYASLFSLGRTYGASVLMHTDMDAILSPIFPKLSIPLLREEQGRPNESEWQIVKELRPLSKNVYPRRNRANFEAAAAGLMGPHVFMLKGNPNEPKLFHPHREYLLKEFTFSSALQSKVESFWKENKMRETSTVWVGFHIRRTDYLSNMESFGKAMPEDVYYHRAMQYYRDKFPGVHFLVASDDIKFVKERLSRFDEVRFTPGTDRGLDMALLASCNHSIFTVGTFGFWCGYLAGGEVVFADVFEDKGYLFSQANMDFFTPLYPY